MEQALALGARACCMALFVVVGCDQVASTPQQPPRPLATKNAVIVSGYGLPDCYVGMKVSDLSADWVAGDVLFPDLYSANNQDSATFIRADAGISVSCRDWVVETVVFMLDEGGRQIQDFEGVTVDGITADSSYVDVISIHNEPEAISCTVYEGKDVGFDYLRQGINFRFRNDRIQSIVVYPKKVPPYTSLEVREFGDTGEMWQLVRQTMSDKLETEGESGIAPSR